MKSGSAVEPEWLLEVVHFRERKPIMKTIIPFCSLSLMLSVAAIKAASPAGLEALEPFLDAHTVVVGRLDLEGVDVAASIAGFIELVPKPREFWVEPIGELEATIGPWQKEFIEAGGRRVYVIVSLAWLGAYPPVALISPLGDGMDGDRLRSLFAKSNPGWQVEVRDRCVIAAPGFVAQRLEQRAATGELERWKAAFEGVPAGFVQVVALPYAESERVWQDLMPRLPAALGGGPGSILARGFRWGALSLKQPPEGALNATIQSESPESAEALRAVIENGLVMIGRLPEVQQGVAGWDDLRALLVPVVEGDRLRWELSLKEVAGLVRHLEPPLEKARNEAMQIRMVNQLKQIGLGMMIHANEQGDRLPPHLVDIVKFLGDARVLMRPDDTRTPPSDFGSLSRADQLAWIDRHSPFEYVLPGVSIKEIKSPDTTVLVYERSDDSPVGVVFADGHVERVSIERLKELLLKPEMGPK
jgi:prepilin-type processing-associated H-X9-DG protein